MPLHTPDESGKNRFCAVGQRDRRDVAEQSPLITRFIHKALEKLKSLYTRPIGSTIDVDIFPQRRAVSDNDSHP